MEYLINTKKYSFSYSELKEDYLDYTSMSSAKFFSDIPKVLHFVCIVSYIKELPTYILLSDEGLIHQLVHLMDNQTKDEPNIDNTSVRRQIRRDFKTLCKLA